MGRRDRAIPDCDCIFDRHFEKRERPAAFGVQLWCSFPACPAIVVMLNCVDDFGSEWLVPELSEIAANPRMRDLRNQQPRRRPVREFDIATNHEDASPKPPPPGVSRISVSL